MFARILTLSGVLLLGAAALLMNPAEKAAAQAYGPMGGAASGATTTRPAAAATLTLTTAEKADLRYMVEEEKVAHDVYTALYAAYGLPVFKNIAAAEQQHMEAVRTLLSRYGLSDPTVGQAAGHFVNPDLQALYDTLTAQGEESIEAALIVGALIEETDIADLREARTRTVKADIKNVYDSLERGSNNHLRSFVGRLAGYGVVYEPQVLSQADYDAIINSSMQTGNGNGNGSGNGGGGWRGGRP